MPVKLLADAAHQFVVCQPVQLWTHIFDREVALNFNPISQNEDYGLSVQVDWDFSDAATLTSITAWRKFDSFDEIDADFTDLDALVDTNDDRVSGDPDQGSRLNLSLSDGQYTVRAVSYDPGALGNFTLTITFQ